MVESGSVLQEKSFEFAISIIQTYKRLVETHKEFVLSKQLLKAGTAIGALIREGAYAQSKADFVSKLSIALKEANETEYWLLLLKQSDYLDESKATELIDKNKSLIRMLISSIKTAKSNLNK
ncbi:MAG: four helix bundle protein [Bacteroidetes bacterium]|nr:four helix bundle protein [Bacteroidota bacterium]